MSCRRLVAMLARLSVFSLAFAACSEDCVQPPCLSPTAILLTITAAASGAPVSGAVVTVNGASSGVPCFSQSTGTLCVVSGYAGTYKLSVAAPGFQSLLRTVVVSGESPSGCGCPSIDTQQISIALVPTP
jgi:hypothetical protein